MVKVKCGSCGKTAYPTESIAYEARVKQTAMRHYKCPINGTWHLTTSPPPGKLVVISKTRKGWTVANASHAQWRFDTYQQALLFANKRARRYLRNRAKYAFEALKPVQMELF